MHKAVFLDRDGTIVEDLGYLNRPDQLKFIPGSIEAIKMLQDAGYKVVVITNQAGVARGLVTEDMLQTIDKTMHKWILSGGAHLDGIYYCPHHPEHGAYPYKQACECRKPHPGLLLKAQKELGLDLERSFMVGDKSTDIEAGQRVGARAVFVNSGPHGDQLSKLAKPPDHVAADLRAAAAWILKNNG